MNRRQFAYWISAGLFSLGERLNAGTLDSLAAMVMQCVETKVDGQTVVEQHRWSYQEDNSWRWFERETEIDGQWELSGRTRPIHRMSGVLAPYKDGYLPESEVPDELRFGSTTDAEQTDYPDDQPDEYPDEDDYGEASDIRRARDGRPPSKWLRSLHAEELRLWLPRIEVPAASVSGMTVWTHLTRDHRFDLEKIRGLTDPQLAKLHAAAHFGY